MKIKIEAGAVMPHKAHEHDAGWDIHSNESAKINPGKAKTIKTGVHLAIPVGMQATVSQRSGLISRHGILCATGIIDSGYIGDIGVTLINTTDKVFIVNKGDRIAQLVFHAVPDIWFEEVEELADTERGSNGFGSTGI